MRPNFGPTGLAMMTGNVLFSLICVPLLAFMASSCTRLELTVRSKHSRKSEASSDIKTDTKTLDQQEGEAAMTWKSVDDYNAHADELKTMSTNSLLKIYHAGGRNRIRLGFRRSRDAIVREAAHDDSDRATQWGGLQLGECTVIEKADIFALGAYGNLGQLIDMSFLGNLKADELKDFNPNVPQDIDEVTKLVFFEFGIHVQGKSTYSVNETTSRMQTTVDWHIIHEKGEEQAWKDSDRSEVRLTFTREQQENGDQTLDLEAVVGRDLASASEDLSLPAISLHYIKAAAGTQRVTIKKGFRSIGGTWKDVRVSRRIELLQDLLRGELFNLIDTQRVGFEGESRRSFSISFKDHQICETDSTEAPH